MPSTSCVDNLNSEDKIPHPLSLLDLQSILARFALSDETTKWKTDRYTRLFCVLSEHKVPNPWCSIHGRYKQQRGLAPSPGPGVQEEGDGLSTSQVIAERGGGRRSVELAEAQSGGSVLPWLATPSRGQASGRMYDVRASRNAPALRPPASPSVLWTRGVRCSRTGAQSALPGPWTVGP